MTKTTQTQPRFMPIENSAEFPNDSDTCWWWDTARPLKRGQPFMAVQTRCKHDPNNFMRCTDMRLLFTDQAEYFAVCQDCYSAYRGKQWSGSTRGGPQWRERAYAYLARHEATKGWCEFCDPVFGDGGWL